jgi:hypothetical protein
MTEPSCSPSTTEFAPLDSFADAFAKLSADFANAGAPSRMSSIICAIVPTASANTLSRSSILFVRSEAGETVESACQLVCLVEEKPAEQHYSKDSLGLRGQRPWNLRIFDARAI